MRRILRARLLASALVVSLVPFAATAVPSQAQYRSEASFDNFHGQLARYGDWVYSDRWGLVWQPSDVPGDFRPYYSGGRWAYTGDYGWTWASDYEWGDIAFHYGRWVDDPYDGWMWIPGYTWSPGWVIWRSNSRSIGWMAMPPDNQFLGSSNDNYFSMSFGGVSINWNDTSGNYGYSRWYGRDYSKKRFAANWTFVDTGRMADRDYSRVAYTPDRASISIRLTTNITNYKVVNNTMVNRSVDARTIERASGHPIVAAAPSAVFKHPDSVMTVDAGQKARAREFDRAPHGTGLAGSAPPPPPTVIDKLSDHRAARHDGATPATPDMGPKGPSRLFTKSTITAPAATSQFHGKLRPGAMVTSPVNTPPPASAPALQPVPAVNAPAISKPVHGTMTGPRDDKTTSLPGGKSHEQRSGGPAVVPIPSSGPAGGQGLPLEHKPLPAVTGPTAQPVAKPMEHKMMPPAAEPVVKPMEHKIIPPPVEPVVKPMEHKVMPPPAEPVAKPMEHKMMPPPAEPVAKPMEHKMMPPPAEPKAEAPAPEVHAPPPVVDSAPPPDKPQDEPKKGERNKGERKNKDGQNPSN